MLTFALFLACGGAPPPDAEQEQPAAEQTPGSPKPPPRGSGPIIAVSVPLSGTNAALGQAAVEGVRLAVPPGLDVWAIDENLGDPTPVAANEPRVVGVVAHVTEVGAERWAHGWLSRDVPVVMAAPASVGGVPRVLAGSDRHLRCATAWVPRGRTLVVHDGSTESIAVSNAANQVLGRSSMGVRAIDPRQMATEAGHVRKGSPKTVMFTGDAVNGGNLLRTLRQTEDQTYFIGLGMYDPRFLKAAGSAARDAVVTSQDRPALDLGVRDRWVAAHGGEPPAVALNAYDAARLLVEAWSSAEAPSKEAQRAAIKERLAAVEVEGASGTFHLDDDLVATPAWCTSFTAADGAFTFNGVARVVDGKVEVVDLPAERAAQEAERARIAEEEARLQAELREDEEFARQAALEASARVEAAAKAAEEQQQPQSADAP